MQRAWCEYRDMEYVEGYVNPLPSDNFEKGYEYGHRDALGSQWHSMDETPQDGKQIIIINKAYDTKGIYHEFTSCIEYNSEKGFPYIGGILTVVGLKALAWMYIPELPKNESK